MIRSIGTCLFVCVVTCSEAQPRQVSIGVFSGITIPFTWDQGINSDPRYIERYDVKPAPIGLCYSVDFAKFGFMATPSLITIGQNYQVINSVGGHEGIRRIRMNYLQVPICFKMHVIHLPFFRVSLTAGAGPGLLLGAKETISHGFAKFRFPSAVYPSLPPDYLVQPDGVLAPKVSDYKMLNKSDFNTLQWFASGGIKADWDVTAQWRLSLDGRGSYGITETRADSYLEKVRQNLMIYDMPGKRREIYISITLGIARYFHVDKDKETKNKSFKKNNPKKYPGAPPARNKRRS